MSKFTILRITRIPISIHTAEAAIIKFPAGVMNSSEIYPGAVTYSAPMTNIGMMPMIIADAFASEANALTFCFIF